MPASEVRTFSSSLEANVEILRNLSEVASSSVANKVVEAFTGISNAVDFLSEHLSEEKDRSGQNLSNIRTLEMPNGHDGSLDNQSDINSISSLSNSEHRPSTNTGSQTTGTHSLNHSSEEILGDSLSSFTHDDFPPSANPVNQTRPLVQGEAVNENGSFEGNSSMRTDVLNPPLINVETGATPLAHGYPVIEGEVMGEAVVNNNEASIQAFEWHSEHAQRAIEQSDFVLARTHYRAISDLAQNELTAIEQHGQENNHDVQSWITIRNSARVNVDLLTTHIEEENATCAIS